LLTVNTTGDFAYNGLIEQNVALTKAGTGTLRLGAASTYRGATTIASGVLVVNASLSGTSSIDVQSGATMDVSGILAGFELGPEQVLKGGGSVLGAVITDGTIAPGSSGSGTLTVTALTAFNTGSTLELELNSAASFDRFVTNGISLDGTVTLNINLGVRRRSEQRSSSLSITRARMRLAGRPDGFTLNGPAGVLSEGEEFLLGAQLFSITYQRRCWRERRYPRRPS
jgi:autotransporter-associated beta strand protein